MRRAAQASMRSSIRSASCRAVTSVAADGSGSGGCRRDRRASVARRTRGPPRPDRGRPLPRRAAHSPVPSPIRDPCRDHCFPPDCRVVATTTTFGGSAGACLTTAFGGAVCPGLSWTYWMTCLTDGAGRCGFGHRRLHGGGRGARTRCRERGDQGTCRGHGTHPERDPEGTSVRPGLRHVAEGCGPSRLPAAAVAVLLRGGCPSRMPGISRRPLPAPTPRRRP